MNIYFNYTQCNNVNVIKYSNPGAPERRCFNDGQYLDGKELFKRLCLPQKIKTSRSYSTKVEAAKDEKTLDQCIRDAAEDDARE